MKNFIMFLSLIGASNSNAMSLHPCTPIVPAQPIYMFCKDSQTTYSIKVDILMSRPIEMCTGSLYQEYHTATVTATNGGNQSSTVTLYNKSFVFSLNADGSASFDSNKPALHLKDCVTPVNGGGFSIGN
ncbi:MAG: hypothetical protein ACXVCY_09925 [Pseudobdellovibrionaceae bacterium]